MNLLVFDFGCHSSSASVIQVSGKEFKVISSTGSSKAGGKDIDNILVEHCLKSLASSQKKRIQSNCRALYWLERTCEIAKYTLSTSHECTISVPSLLEGFNFRLDITRNTFEGLCQGVFNTAIAVVKEAMARSLLTSHNINKVLIAGGSNNIPKMKALVESLAIRQAPVLFTASDAISEGPHSWHRKNTGLRKIPPP
ncbi:Hsp70 chaperone [Entomophthora muscae]|uniref:Hsp70 chaperone n=1 Tax=Entomophthora muscae TaxID=34485 RepID=A0ACC2RVE1_9FUNG|nr:Hsp70 chaperone [Entomophthora muscae]